MKSANAIAKLNALTKIKLQDEFNLVESNP